VRRKQPRVPPHTHPGMEGTFVVTHDLLPEPHHVTHETGGNDQVVDVTAIIRVLGVDDGYIPYQPDLATGLANSPLWSDGTNVGFNNAAPSARASFKTTVDLESSSGAGYGPTIDIINSDGTVTLEIRSAPDWSWNTYIGYAAGMFSDIDGWDNTAIGYGALSSIVDGTTNTAVGVMALAASVHGYDNTACGHNALQASTDSPNDAFGSAALGLLNEGWGNVAIGQFTLGFLTNGCGNTAIGTLALGYCQLDDPLETHGNTAVGFMTLRGNGVDPNVGTLNTAVGAFALTEIASGSRNVAIGGGSDSIPALAPLGANATGDDNIAIGVGALAASVGLSGNIAIGTGALENNIGGSDDEGLYNLAIGNLALNANTIGYENVAIGQNVLWLNTVGHHNVAIGGGPHEAPAACAAMYSNTTGSYNTAIGNGALYSCGSANSNVAVGYRALFYCTLGGNVAVGREAGIDLYAGAYCTFIGDGADVASHDLSEVIAIGHNAIGTKDNQVVLGNEYIEETLLRKNVGVGKIDPHSYLDVGGSVAAAYLEITAARTLDETDCQVDCTANSFTITLPTAIGIAGRIYSIKNSGSGLITVAPDGAETIDGDPSAQIGPHENLELRSTGAGWIKTEFRPVVLCCDGDVLTYENEVLYG